MITKNDVFLALKAMVALMVHPGKKMDKVKD